MASLKYLINCLGTQYIQIETYNTIAEWLYNTGKRAWTDTNSITDDKRTNKHQTRTDKRRYFWHQTIHALNMCTHAKHVYTGCTQTVHVCTGNSMYSVQYE